VCDLDGVVPFDLGEEVEEKPMIFQNTIKSGMDAPIQKILLRNRAGMREVLSSASATSACGTSISG